MQLVANYTPLRPRFNQRIVHVRSVKDTVARFFQGHFGFPLPVFKSPVLHIQLSSGFGAMGQGAEGIRVTQRHRWYNRM